MDFEKPVLYAPSPIRFKAAEVRAMLGKYTDPDNQEWFIQIRVDSEGRLIVVES